MKKKNLLIVLICIIAFGNSISAQTSICKCDHIHDADHICTCADDCQLKPMLIGCDAEFSPCP